ncbi:MAG: thioesterase family protein [Blastocatellia bacterium]|nr:thioesterase family protein [Chloracidobacterium sp.]MBL8183916.1 thioesterase family protein [Blastocatellia bacterium]HBE84163.1 thioesterase [Blastocatellia bacterium]HRJ90320.1 thioesterase family protein [Pyrinomonadaceae bacterium]HRK49518.1 thioesterase family protein [Pyrinomonadaceae bacterium]
MGPRFEKLFEAGWRHVDPNGHVANMVYLEYAVDTRIAFFASQGFPPGDFGRLGFGPVIKSDFVEYFREVKMLDKISVTMENGGVSPDSSRFRVVNNFYMHDGTHAARVTSVGGWLGLKERKLVEPPEKLKDAWNQLVKTEDFEELRSSIKR